MSKERDASAERRTEEQGATETNYLKAGRERCVERPSCNEMRCGGYQKIYVAKPFAWGIIFFLLLSSSFVVSHPRRSNEANGLPGYLRPLSRQPSTPLTLDHPSHPRPHLNPPIRPPHPVPHPNTAYSSLRLPLPIPVPQALLQRRAPYPQLMQLLARVPRPRPPPPLPLPIGPTLRAAIRPTSKSPRREPEPEPGFPRMDQRRNRIERVARADAREAAQHDVVLVRERVERVERVQLRCVHG